MDTMRIRKPGGWVNYTPIHQRGNTVVMFTGPDGPDAMDYANLKNTSATHFNRELTNAEVLAAGHTPEVRGYEYRCLT
jgi:hypothetical protein